MKRRRPSPQGYDDPIGAYCIGRIRHACALAAAADLEYLALFGGGRPDEFGLETVYTSALVKVVGNGFERQARLAMLP